MMGTGGGIEAKCLQKYHKSWGGSNGIGQHPGPVGWGHSLPPADDSGFETWGLGI